MSPPLLALSASKQLLPDGEPKGKMAANEWNPCQPLSLADQLYGFPLLAESPT